MSDRHSAQRTVTAGRPVHLALTLAPLRRGPGDPCHKVTANGARWHATRAASGPVTARFTQDAPDAVTVRAWGPGTTEFLDRLPRLLCLDEDVAGFAPEHRLIAEAHRRFPGLRMLRTGQVFEALAPAILEQRVHIVSAHASWRKLVGQFGDPAPGPTPEPMRLPPTAEAWRRIPSWTFHRANVDPQRAKTIVLAARMADKLEQAATMDHAAAAARLRTVPGVGEWTAAEVAQRALGDPDALSVGDFHLAKLVGWTLLGRPLDDAAMVEYLEPLRPHRYRAVRLLQAAGFAHKPKFGPRTPLVDISNI